MPISTAYRPFRGVSEELSDGFSDAVEPAKFPRRILRFRNQDWAERVGLGELTQDEWEKYFARFEPMPQNLPAPLALRYHGHQFRTYNPDLGDGRGFLYAQLRDLKDGRALDLGTKGSGQTPYSRRGDGRLTLKGAVREALATEMLESLGVYTSKTFSIFETGEALVRHDEPSPTRSGVLVRLNHGHVRFGTFQRLAFLGEPKRIEQLVDYCIRNFYPQLLGLPAEEKASSLLAEVTRVSADLAAGWMIAGFVHGVLNTDNMNISGESFDYGPYRFLPKYDPGFTAAYFDQSGLYSYGRQPECVLWNLEQLAQALSALSSQERLVQALQGFSERFNQKVVALFVDRIGLEPQGDELDSELFMSAFSLMATSQVHFEQFFHDWYGGIASRKRAEQSPEAQLYQGQHFEVFIRLLSRYKTTAPAADRLRDVFFSRPHPCALLIDEIETIWEAIAKSDDWSRFEAKIKEIRVMGNLYGRRKI